MYNSGRHDAHTRANQQARRHLRAGMAKCAIRSKVSGRPEVDCVGRPLLYSNEMSERHSLPTLERWAKGYSAIVVGKPTQRWCPRCKAAGRDPFQPVRHAC